MKDKVCSNCGHDLKNSNIICAYCGYSIDKGNDEKIKINTQKLTIEGKKASISAGRTIALTALIMNIITISISIGDYSLAYVCLLAATGGAIVSLLLVILSFSINKNSDLEEVERKLSTIMHIAIGVFIFSGCDFLVAINFALFGF